MIFAEDFRDDKKRAGARCGLCGKVLTLNETNLHTCSRPYHLSKEDIRHFTRVYWIASAISFLTGLAIGVAL